MGMMEMMGVVAIGKTVIRHASASSWFEEAEASDGNSARDAQGGELERAKVQRGTFGVLPTVLQRDWKIGGQIVAFQHIGLMHRSACERRADVQHGISLATGRLIGTYDQVAGTIIGQLHPVQHHGTIDGLNRGERRDIGHIME